MKFLVTIILLLAGVMAAHAQQAQDSTATQVNTKQDKKGDSKKVKGKKKEAPTNTDTQTEAPQTDHTKAKGKKKGKAEAQAVKLDSASTRADSINASLPKALRNAKTAKKTSTKKVNPNKPVKPEPKNEPKIIPGAEAKANAEVKDKQDRTMKGPSGQKVYTSPKGGKYYIDVNGNKKYLKRDIPDAK
jgi:colicin import membrane protein